ncbi:hypothetical protein [Pontiella sulfatireligans]|uniref:Uncharacterized protein n=1 Tax=Pontiella sulfatireligans TaxID=2750658 RepID=A0A6C2UGN1_9BACT|nr:hypothetical protein [Pontiella sulfatireligans]VGO18524.1 hypothetical protein SCARR_00577 [Pontiella sulfatireligans]
MKNKRATRTALYSCAILLGASALFAGCATQPKESAAAKRYRKLGQLQEQDNEFYTEFFASNVTGIGRKGQSESAD